MTLQELIDFANDNGLDLETEICVGDHVRKDYDIDKLEVVTYSSLRPCISIDLRGHVITE